MEVVDAVGGFLPAPGDFPPRVQEEAQMVELGIGLPDQRGCPPKGEFVEGSRPYRNLSEPDELLVRAEIGRVVAADVHGHVRLGHKRAPGVESVGDR